MAKFQSLKYSLLQNSLLQKKHRAVLTSDSFPSWQRSHSVNQLRDEVKAYSNQQKKIWPREEGRYFLWNIGMQARVWGKPPTKEKQACEVDIKPPMLPFHVSWTAYRYLKKAQLDASTLNYIPVSVASWELMCLTGHYGPEEDTECSWKRRKLWPPLVQHLWHKQGHFIQLQSGFATSKPSGRGFIPSCLWYPGKLKNFMWVFVLIRRKGWKKPPWLFVAYVTSENMCYCSETSQHAKS